LSFNLEKQPENTKVYLNDAYLNTSTALDAE